MKIASVVKVIGAATAGSSAVAAPTSLAVINHKQKTTITQVTQKLEEAEMENSKLVKKNEDIDSKHKELQRLDAAESYKSRQEIDQLKKEVAKEKAAAKELQNKFKKIEEYNDQLKKCVYMFVSEVMDLPPIHVPNTEYSYRERHNAMDWCAKESQPQGFDQHVQQQQYHYYQ